MFAQGAAAYILCLIKTGNALKLLKKYLGSISRVCAGVASAKSKSFSRRPRRCAPQGEVYITNPPPPHKRLEINYRSA